MADEKQYDYRDPGRVAGVVKILIAILIAGYAVELVLLVMQLSLLSDFQAHVFPTQALAVAAGQANDTRLHASSLLLLVLMMVVVVAYLVWVYRASANVHALGATGLGASAGMAVGMYFIPFYNLVAPVTAMIEIRKASQDAPNWAAQKNSPIVAIWWSLQILTIGGSVVSQLASAAFGKDIAGLKELTAVLIGVFAVNLTFHIAQFVLVNGVSKMQVAQHARGALHSETFA